jgi:hypothetical protein
LEIGFIDHLQVVTASKYNIIANLHILQITTAHAFLVCCVFTSRSLVTVSNGRDPSASAVTSLLFGVYPTNLLTAPTKPFSSKTPLQLSVLASTVILITFRNEPRRKHRSLLYCSRFPVNMIVCEGVTQ